MENLKQNQPKSSENLRMIGYVTINNQTIKICCETYETIKRDTLKENEMNVPIHAGLHLKFSPVSLPKNMEMKDFKQLADDLGLKVCKENRNEERYILKKGFHLGMTLTECALKAAEWFNSFKEDGIKGQPIKDSMSHAGGENVVHLHEGGHH